MNNIFFGPAGKGDSFETLGFKKMSDIPQYLQKFNLTAFEYQCGRGVRYDAKTMEILREQGAKTGVCYSIHAPYYISMSSVEEEKRIGSTRYILESAKALRLLDGKRIIFHSGSCGKLSREVALEFAMETMQRFVSAMDENGYSDMILCPETMGKINQLGTLDEVLSLCSVDKRITP
ncbi:MAG: TIM barrel protein, partial [Oscillospiraceae bacterium]